MTIVPECAPLSTPGCLELGPEERGAFAEAMLRQHGVTIYREALKEAGGWRWDDRWPSAGNPGYEDPLNDLIAHMMAALPDFLLPEYGQDAGKWLRSVILNRKRQQERNYWRRRRILERGILTHERWLTSVRLHENPETAYIRRETEREILDRLTRLPGHLAEVAVLRYDGWSYREIAGFLGITENAAMQRVSKIRSPRLRSRVI